ncbi:MAG: SufE family protein [Prochlorococcus sp.]|jgi:cysteine desulfuration protein SufE|nr:SufE family protein [Prochlorococcus sp.]MDP6192840.1 SufE family protein [Prochlorococcaceae cyanobacterium ETNP18_MAG_1]
MAESSSYGSEALDTMVGRLKNSPDPRRRYEYVLWLAKKLPTLDESLQTVDIKVKGCVSQVYVRGELQEGRLQWQGDSDALITKGLLAMLIQGLNNLTPEEVMAVDPSFIEATGLNASLTPSRANGFLNILLAMKSQAQQLATG